MRIQRHFAFQPCWSCFLDYFCRARRNTHENLFGKVKGVAPGKSYPPPRASNMIVPRKRRASRFKLNDRDESSEHSQEPAGFRNYKRCGVEVVGAFAQPMPDRGLPASILSPRFGRA